MKNTNLKNLIYISLIRAQRIIFAKKFLSFPDIDILIQKTLTRYMLTKKKFKTIISKRVKKKIKTK